VTLSVTTVTAWAGVSDLNRRGRRRRRVGPGEPRPVSDAGTRARCHTASVYNSQTASEGPTLRLRRRQEPRVSGRTST
jgi:hypothetical protein